MNHNFKKILLAAAAGSLFALAGCTADGKGDGSENIGGGGPDSVFPNDGTTPSNVTEGGVLIPGNFICEKGARAFGGDPDTFVTTNGLVADPVADLVALLGAGSVPTLLASVTEKDNVKDGDISTFATFTLTLDLASLVSNVEEAVAINSVVPSGKYAVFAVRFPRALVEASVLFNVTVTTFLGGVQQEAITADATTIDLLGAVGTGPVRAFIGVKTTKDYDTASVRLGAGLISVNVGEAMFVHELCTEGRFING